MGKALALLAFLAACILASGLACYGVWDASYLGFAEVPVERAFDSAAWRAQGNHERQNSPRESMVVSLIKSELLNGKTRLQVVELLGDPMLLGDHPLSESTDFYYMLGMGLIDPWILVVRFAENGQVESYRRFNG